MSVLTDDLAQLQMRSPGLIPPAAWNHLLRIIASLELVQVIGFPGATAEVGVGGTTLRFPTATPWVRLINAERARAESAEAFETSRAEGAEADLSDAIDALTAALAAEVARATAAEDVLTTAIADETTRAEGVEGTIEDEIGAIEADIITLQGQVTYLEGVASDYELLISNAHFADGADMGTELYNFVYNAGYWGGGVGPWWGDLGTAIYDLYNNAGYSDLAALGTGLYDLYNNPGYPDLAALGTDLDWINNTVLDLNDNWLGGSFG